MRFRELLAIICLLPPATNAVLAQPSNVTEPDMSIVDRVRVYPAPAHAQDLRSGTISGSNTGNSDDYHQLGVIQESPAPDQWTEIHLQSERPYRFIRYNSPPGSHCRIAELQLYAGARRIKGAVFSSQGPNEGVLREAGSSQKAVDDKVETFFETKAPDGQFIGLDLQDQASCKTPKFNPAPGTFAAPVEVSITSRTKDAAIFYTVDGSHPDKSIGQRYTKPLTLAKTTGLQAIAVKDDCASSQVGFGAYLIGEPVLKLRTLHVGNSLTATTRALPVYASSMGIEEKQEMFLHGGATTEVLWKDATGPKRRMGKGIASICSYRPHDTATA